ncbi:IucA/IucC family siderophore biosynthesis protein [Halosimplex rubrum]|uniref:IucA/IucC family siderophore biosynthesis protein n=1 Tax=Halosimplex rubrum TaxID=869889 RepID=A0A7D5T5D5_9EURY|nr:IucA/IucC family protein [Halosimplex rubrum]QLH77493.1 IucA/IucC family siderophore biosynthesis protein [Halosimplex rubrum]
MTRSLTGPAVAGRPAVTHVELTERERAGLAAAFRYAQRHDLSSPPDEAYRRELSAARWGVLARLLGGLARDLPDALPEPLVVDATDPDLPETNADPLASLDGDALTARLPETDGAEDVLLLRFPASEAVVAASVADRRAFGRFAFVSPAVSCRIEATEPVGSPESLVPLLDRERAFDAPEAPERFRAELGESVANLALARLARRVRWADSESTPTPAGPPDRSSVDASAAFDGLVTGGHPFHPGAKIRRGMSPTESLSFAPEFADSLPLRFAAIHRDRALAASVDDRSLTERLYATFSNLRMAVGTALPSGRPVSEYAVVPVHPWQFRHVLPDRYAAAREDGVVVPVPSYTVPVTPLLSLRTVVPEPGSTAADRPPHLKLAIGVQTTNAVRTLSPNAVTNGPQLSGALTAACDALSVSGFGVLSEPAATCYDPPGGPHTDGPGYDDARHLSALARRHPATHSVVEDDRRAVTAAGLLARAPPGRRSVLAATLDSFADGRSASDRSETVESFLAAYLGAVVPGPLRLLVARGVALEAHLQNTHVVFEDGRPTGALVGDFGGVRVHEGRFDGAEVSPHPDSEVFTDDAAAAREKLWYSLFQNHLGELIGRLCATEPVAAADCWRLVRRRCEETFDALAADDAVPDRRVSADRESLFDDRVVHKALTAMRLRDATHDYSRTTVANPLARHARPRARGR